MCIRDSYQIDLVHETLLLSPETVGLIGRCYMDQCRIEDFEAQIEAVSYTHLQPMETVRRKR